MPTDSTATAPSGPAAGRRLRRDAEENRLRLLKAAGEVFAESGFEATMGEIAARAGVGVGTAYRRFANKDEVIGALFADSIAGLVEVAEAALAREDPWDGIVDLLEGTISRQARDRGLRELALSSSRRREYVAEARRLLKPRLEELVARAHRAGRLRPGIDVSDLVVIQKMLAAVSGRSDAAGPEAWRRFLPLVIDGLRPDLSTPLPGKALSTAQLDVVMDSGAPRRQR